MIIISLTHRSLHWNRRLWLILFRNPVPSVGGKLDKNIKIHRNMRRFILLEFISWTEKRSANRSTIFSKKLHSFYVMMTCCIFHTLWKQGDETKLYFNPSRHYSFSNSKVLTILMTDSTCWWPSLPKTKVVSKYVNTKIISCLILLTSVRRRYLCRNSSCPGWRHSSPESRGVRLQRPFDIILLILSFILSRTCCLRQSPPPPPAARREAASFMGPSLA